jgi:hypothetical protein
MSCIIHVKRQNMLSLKPVSPLIHTTTATRMMNLPPIISSDITSSNPPPTLHNIRYVHELPYGLTSSFPVRRPGRRLRPRHHPPHQPAPLPGHHPAENRHQRLAPAQPRLVRRQPPPPLGRGDQTTLHRHHPHHQPPQPLRILHHPPLAGALRPGHPRRRPRARA